MFIKSLSKGGGVHPFPQVAPMAGALVMAEGAFVEASTALVMLLVSA